MSDIAAIEAIVDALVDANNNGVDELEEYAEYVLAALRADGFELYRPDECALLEYWRDGQPYNHHILLIDDDDKPIFGASIPHGTYRLVPVKGGTDA